MKRVLTVIVVGIMLSMSVLATSAAESITPSEVNYEASFRDATLIFLGNKKKVEWNVGDKYFLHYTVERVEKNKTTQSGMIVTPDPSATYPYLKGGMRFMNSSIICEEGYTYFFRFEVTESGLKYVAGKAKGGESSYLQFPHTYGELKTKVPYFGIWIAEGEGFTGKLSHIRCYDEYGTDLGIYAPASSNIDIEDMVAAKGIDHTYSFSLKNAPTISFGNSKKTESNVVFLEYKVSNVEAKNVNQSGALMTSNPGTTYPHGGDGYLNYSPHNTKSPTKLLSEGASYLVRFERGEEKFDVLVKRTLADGTVDYFAFSEYAGKYQNNYGYVGMWIGEICSVTADFTEVKCYDAKGNNLGIRTNKGVNIKHFGNLEDYTQCEAVYYCKETDTFISLDDECNATRRLDGDKSANQGTYFIREAVMTLKIGEEEEQFKYYYNAFTDTEGNRYVRLKEYDVTFKSRFMGGDVIETVKVTAENGYKVTEPQVPSKEGRTFAYWQDSEGHKYDFDEVVMDSMELYAKWEGEQEWALTEVIGSKSNAMTIVIVAMTSIVLAGGTTAGIFYIRKGNRHDSKKKKDS